MKISVQLSELKVYDPELYREVAEMIAQKGLDFDKMETLFIESEAGYWEDAMKKLQASAIEGLRLAEEYRKHKLQPQATPELVAQDVAEPEAPTPRAPRTFADRLIQHS